MQYPDEPSQEPGIHAARSYETTWAVASAITNSGGNVYKGIQSFNFKGLSGKINLTEGNLKRKPAFQIINVVGKSYREIGFWSRELEFYTSNEMEGESQAKGTNSTSILDELGVVYWLGGGPTSP